LIEFIGSKNFEFVIKDEVGVNDLGIYISPDVSKLAILTDIDEVEKPNPWKIVRWPWIILAFIIFVIYIIMQEWYKRYYEVYLFKKRDDLFNIVSFIYNARNSEIYDDEIRRKLKSAKWSGEQITYAFKKIDGKRTGMFEIPVFKWAEKKEVRREIAKRERKIY